jgi:hypothetical protein
MVVHNLPVTADFLKPALISWNSFHILSGVDVWPFCCTHFNLGTVRRWVLCFKLMPPCPRRSKLLPLAVLGAVEWREILLPSRYRRYSVCQPTDKLSYDIRKKNVSLQKPWSLTDESGLSLATFVANWREWSLVDITSLSLTKLPPDNSGLTDKRCLLWTTVAPRCQQWSIVSNRILLLTTVVFYWQQVSLTDNSGPSLTTVVYR